MIWPILITGGILGGLALSAQRASASASTSTPTSMTGPIPDASTQPPAGRTIRIDPDAAGTIRARVGDTIQMHGVGPRSADNPEGYELSILFPPGAGPQLPIDPRALVARIIRREGVNDYHLVQAGAFQIRWAPNHVVTVEVSS